MIRKANDKDINSIVDLWEEMMNFHVQKSDLYTLKPDSEQIYNKFLKEFLKDDGGVIFVYEIENRILGYIMAEEYLHPPVYKENLIGMILEISITKKNQNNGIGEKLVLEIENWFKNRGIDRIECMMSCFNEVANTFWIKHDYKPYNMMCIKKI